MKHELKRIGVISVRKISAAMGLVLGLFYLVFFVPFFILASLGSGMQGQLAFLVVFFLAICLIGFPVMMAIGYGIAAALYNLYAKSMGGVEFELSEKK